MPVSKSNPYQAPGDDVASKSGSPRLLLKTFGIVMGSSIVGGAIGATLGLTMGWLIPGYYRSVFSAGSSPEFDPVAVGLGQGLTQGIVLGCFIGLALVGMHYWFQTRSEPAE